MKDETKGNKMTGFTDSVIAQTNKEAEKKLKEYITELNKEKKIFDLFEQELAFQSVDENYLRYLNRFKDKLEKAIKNYEETAFRVIDGKKTEEIKKQIITNFLEFGHAYSALIQGIESIIKNTTPETQAKLNETKKLFKEYILLCVNNKDYYLFKEKINNSITKMIKRNIRELSQNKELKLFLDEIIMEFKF